MASDAYRQAMAAEDRIIRASAQVGETTYTDDVQSITIDSGTGEEKPIGYAVSAKLTLTLRSSATPPAVGAVLVGRFWTESRPAEQIALPPFTIEGVERDEESGAYTVTGHDAMVQLAAHTAAEISVTYPTTIGAYAAAAVALAGLELAGTDWLGAGAVLSAAPNLSGTETCRAVIAWAAEAALGNAYIDRDGKIAIRSIIPGAQLPTIALTRSFSCKMGKPYGPINTLVLARETQSDNIYRTSAAAGAEKIALTVADNPFLDAIRDDVIDALFAQINGVSVQPYELEWRGDPSIDPGTAWRLTDADGGTYDILYGAETLEYDGGLRATVTRKAPSTETVDYRAAASTREALRKTQLAVDKANQKIEALVQEIETIPAVNVTLSRDTIAVLTDASGTPDLTDAAVTVGCTLGGTDKTADATYTFAPVGLTGGWDAGTHTYTVTAMTATTGYVTITAALDGQKTAKRCTVVQVRNGKDGTNGANGQDGTDGKSSYMHIAYATAADGSTGFSTTNSAGKTYIGTCTDFNASAPTTPSAYHWAKIKGDAGQAGQKGADGVSVTAMTAHYAASASGDTAPTDGWSDTMPERDDTQYLWGYYTVTFSDGTAQDTVPYVVAGAGESYTALSDQIKSVVHEYNTKIDQTKAEILQTASETYATADSVSKLETQVEQTAKQIEFRFSDANGRIQDVSSALADNQKLLEEYIRFKGALMELGRSDSDFIAKLSNEKLAFYEGTNEIAYISNNALNITDAEIRRRLSISYVDDSGEITATYDWIVRSNQHITLARRR